MSKVSCKFVLCFLAFVSPAMNAQEKLPKSWEQDSTLRSVFFIDHDSGWAVGDRGTILRTEDGGRTWNSISSPRDVIWSNVFFINEKVGWIVGGHHRGSLDRSVGVMIRTIDGGKSWENRSKNGIPFIKKINFVDEQHGWLLCDSNTLHQSGLLTTRDGGHQWRNAAGIPTRKLKIARRLNHSSTFVGVDEMNRWIQFDRTVDVGRTVPFDNPEDIVQTQNTLLCIADGKVFESGLSGHWKQVKVADQENVRERESIRWGSATSQGNLVCAVGRPGHTVLRRTNDGDGWETFRTGQAAGLNSVFFLDEERGWAVGELGKIIATKDGGQTWSVQRNADSHVGVMHMVSDPEHISYSAVALLGGSFNHLCDVSVLHNQSTERFDTWKICQALNRAGNASLDFTHVRESSLLFEAVKSLRAKKPSVIFISNQDPIMKRWIRLVVDAAADQEKYKGLTEHGLHPWQVQKVLSVSEKVALDSNVSLDRFAAQLGRTVALQTRFARQLVTHDEKTKMLSWSLISSTVKNTTVNQGMTSGTLAYDGIRCNRKASQLQIDNMQQFRSVSNWNQSLERLGRELIQSPLDEKVWMENVMAATSGMDKLSHAFFLADLAERYTRLRKPVMADYAERMILQNVPGTEVGEKSLLKMIQRFGSIESNQLLNRIVQQRMAKAQNGSGFDSKVQPASASITLDPVRSSDEATAEHPDNIDVTPASLQNATQLIDQFQSRFPDVGSRPETEFLIAQLKNASGNRTALERLLDSANHLDFSSMIGSRMSREKKIGKVDGVVVGSVNALDATRHRVILDGKLDEKFWRPATSDQKLMIAADQEYIYLATETELENDVEVDQGRKRTRDEPLQDFRRKKIFIDFDRDYCSGIELTVDVRGACNDALWRDERTKDFSYDPIWYVASNVENKKWTIEIAIPIQQLPTGTITATSGWVFNTTELNPREPNPQSVSKLLTENRVLLFREKN